MFLKSGVVCQSCHSHVNLVKKNNRADCLSWRYMTATCVKYKQYGCILAGRFFNGFRNPLLLILRIITKYSTRQPIHSIIASLGCNRIVVLRIINLLKDRIPMLAYLPDVFLLIRFRRVVLSYVLCVYCLF